jgi:ribosomal protein L40E
MIWEYRAYAANLEVITIELICENCGTHNPPGTEFCTKCHHYLPWDRSGLPEPAGASPNTGPADQGYPTQREIDPAYQAGVPVGAPTQEQPAYIDKSCPNCGTINPGTRRFCSRCGYQFFNSDSAAYASYDYWSAESQAAQERAAWKAYRRSLPPLYRWRRVIMVVLLVPLGLAAGLAFGRDPVGMVQGGWYSLTRKYVPVQGIRAAVKPPEATAAKSDPAALVDGTENEWTMNWAPGSVSECAAPEGTGVIVLTLPTPIRIRLLQIAPGLNKSNPQHDLQALPTRLGITFDDGKCTPFELKKEEGQQEIFLDSKEQVTQVRISIAAADSPANAQPLVSITEVILKAYPS